ncbi:transferase family protein [Hirsutella rhossiliensis]|uniref:Transferase family domain-containing protein n=1 Tax=Hirsutella rhossiliensis TaxID=111463 RepID=A0A9P8SQ39_9HYPO|nr:transferase family domain-containing protein [Hirsutella rhossiliensis]KAH0968826.1 transferase family domain-containing protein [Hirsutella rhossiliensis]
MDGISVAAVKAAWAAHAARIAEIVDSKDWDNEVDVDWAQTLKQHSATIIDTHIFGPRKSDTETLDPVVTEGLYAILKKNPRSWRMLGLDYRPREMSSTVLAAKIAPGTTVTRMFLIDRYNLERLKNTCSISDRVSTTEAVAALLWRCAVRARTGLDEQNRDEPSTLMMAMDVRNDVSPTITDGFLGNAVLYSHTCSTTRQLSNRQTSLGSITNELRTSLREHRQPQVILETLQLAASIPDVHNLGLLHPTWLANDVVFSSLYKLPFYDISWGNTFGEQGTPDYFRFPQGVFDGVCFLMPRRKDGSVELQITMTEAHMQNLVQDLEFRNYAAQWAPSCKPAM